MKSRIYRYIFIFFYILTVGLAKGELVEVFVCVRYQHDISFGSLSLRVNKDTKFVGLTVYSPGKKLGDIQFEKSLREEHKKALEYDQSADPFFGQGQYFLLKNDEDYYIVFYEKDVQNEALNGKRYGIGKLVRLGNLSQVFAGSPFDGVSFDKKVLGMLEKFSRVNRPPPKPGK